SFARDAVTTVTVRHPEPGVSGATLSDHAGRPVPAVTEAVLRHPDGTLAEITLTFVARQVPALGYRVYRVLPSDTTPAGWTRRPGEPAIENPAFRDEGGHRAYDRRRGRALGRADGRARALGPQAEHRMAA